MKQQKVMMFITGVSLMLVVVLLFILWSKDEPPVGERLHEGKDIVANAAAEESDVHSLEHEPELRSELESEPESEPESETALDSSVVDGAEGTNGTDGTDGAELEGEAGSAPMSASENELAPAPEIIAPTSELEIVPVELDVTPAPVPDPEIVLAAGNVTGTVTFSDDGSAVPFGRIGLMNEETKEHYNVQIKQGKIDIKLPDGTYLLFHYSYEENRKTYPSSWIDKDQLFHVNGQTTLDFSLHRLYPHTLALTHSAQPGLSMANYMISYYRVPYSNHSFGRGLSDNEAVLYLPLGQYEIYQIDDPNRHRMKVDYQFTVTADEHQTLTIDLAPYSFNVHGIFTDADGRTIEDFRYLQIVNSQYRQEPIVVIVSDGKFATRLEPGDYVIDAYFSSMDGVTTMNHIDPVPFTVTAEGKTEVAIALHRVRVVIDDEGENIDFTRAQIIYTDRENQHNMLSQVFDEPEFDLLLPEGEWQLYSINLTNYRTVNLLDNIKVDVPEIDYLEIVFPGVGDN